MVIQCQLVNDEVPIPKKEDFYEKNLMHSNVFPYTNDIEMILIILILEGKYEEKNSYNIGNFYY